jgi:lipid II:glycine glycyltransferase (peptidoglycan interpeptide bridge formation enzyme)
MFRAMSQGKTVGAHLWYMQGEVAYSHLAASTEQGYRVMASYALYSCALGYFAGKVRWLDLGGGAGVRSDDEDGLSRFKRGGS